MSEIADTELVEIGWDAARLVAADGVVERVAVAFGQDPADKLVYFFSFLISPDHIQQQLGSVHIHLAQKLRDALMARGDEHYPFVEFLSRADWDRRRSA